MSFKITIQASGLNISAQLKDEALVAVLQIIQEKREESATAVPPLSQGSTAISTIQDVPLDGEDNVKTAIKDLGGAELLNKVGWESFPEKILLLGAWYEARGGATPWRSADMDDTFKLAKEGSPANFPRDISNAIKSGWVHNETPRTYTVTRTGWNKIGQALRELNS